MSLDNVGYYIKQMDVHDRAKNMWTNVQSLQGNSSLRARYDVAWSKPKEQVSKVKLVTLEVLGEKWE